MKIIADEYMSDFIEVLDLDSGKLLDRCKWANQETGEYLEISFTKSKGRKETLKKGNIVLVYKGE